MVNNMVKKNMSLLEKPKGSIGSNSRHDKRHGGNCHAVTNQHSVSKRLT